MSTTVDGLVEYVEHFQHRVLQDAIANATAGQLRHRAVAFALAAPREGDFNGHATQAQLQAARERCQETARACAAAARVALLGGDL